MQLEGVHHVGICVTELEPAVAFYTDVLGLTLMDNRPDFGIAGAWLACGDQQVHLLVHDMPESKGQHLAFRVRDLDAVVAELRGRGLEVRGPSEIPGIARQAMVHDPSGNLVELNEPAG